MHVFVCGFLHKIGQWESWLFLHSSGRFRENEPGVWQIVRNLSYYS